MVRNTIRTAKKLMRIKKYKMYRLEKRSNQGSFKNFSYHAESMATSRDLTYMDNVDSNVAGT